MRNRKKGVKNIVIIIIVVVLICLGLYIFVINKDDTPKQTAASEKFKALQNYLTNNGYECQNLNYAGSSCAKTNDVNKFSLFRYDDGLHYITESENYKVNILTRKESKDISIETFEGAFEGYKNKKYICTSETGTILTSNIECKTEDKELLDNEVYLNIVKIALSEVRVIIDSSGYSANKLVTEYDWTK